jgi:hypothetical protein
MGRDEIKRTMGFRLWESRVSREPVPGTLPQMDEPDEVRRLILSMPLAAA